MPDITVNIQGTEYKLGKFSDLHLSPIAEFIQGGLKTDLNSWKVAAVMIKKLVPNLPVDLVDDKAGEIYLSVTELKTIYTAAMDKLGINSDTYGKTEVENPEVMNLKKQLAEAEAQQQNK